MGEEAQALNAGRETIDHVVEALQDTMLREDTEASSVLWGTIEDLDRLYASRAAQETVVNWSDLWIRIIQHAINQDARSFVLLRLLEQVEDFFAKHAERGSAHTVYAALWKQLTTRAAAAQNLWLLNKVLLGSRNRVNRSDSRSHEEVINFIRRLLADPRLAAALRVDSDYHEALVQLLTPEEPRHGAGAERKQNPLSGGATPRRRSGAGAGLGLGLGLGLGSGASAGEEAGSGGASNFGLPPGSGSGFALRSVFRSGSGRNQGQEDVDSESSDGGGRRRREAKGNSRNAGARSRQPKAERPQKRIHSRGNDEKNDNSGQGEEKRQRRAAEVLEAPGVPALPAVLPGGSEAPQSGLMRSLLLNLANVGGAASPELSPSFFDSDRDRNREEKRQEREQERDEDSARQDVWAQLGLSRNSPNRDARRRHSGSGSNSDNDKPSRNRLRNNNASGAESRGSASRSTNENDSPLVPPPLGGRQPSQNSNNVSNRR